MKPAPFEYFSPTTTEEALTHLAENGYDAKVIAGGQSLIPMMNFRLVQPSILVDINNIQELGFIREDEKGSLRIGATARHHQVEKHALVATIAPLLRDTMPKIGTSQIRSRGTFGGSISHADPSAELVSVSVALDGRFRVRNQSGEKWIQAEDFFIGLFTTVLEPEDLLVEIEIPRMQPRTGWAILEVARRPHDFALVGVAAVVTLDERNACSRARLVYLSAGEGPMIGRQAAKVLQGNTPTAGLIEEAAETAAAYDIDPGSDIHATAEFRRHLAKVLTRRALEQALKRAAGAQ